jgi:hypothetical protein
MSSRKKMPVWVDMRSHRVLREYCDRVGKTGIVVLSELICRHLVDHTEIKSVRSFQDIEGPDEDAYIPVVKTDKGHLDDGGSLVVTPKRGKAMGGVWIV